MQSYIPHLQSLLFAPSRATARDRIGSDNVYGEIGGLHSTYNKI